MDAAGVAELQEQTVRAGGVIPSSNASSGGGVDYRVHVLEGEVARAQDDEVPAGAEVGLQVADDRAGAAHEEADLAGVLVQRHVVAVGRRPLARRGQRERREVAGSEEVDAERVLGAAGAEVGERAVHARVGQRRSGTVQAPSEPWTGCRCW